MKNPLCVFVSLFLLTTGFAQSPRIRADKYPSLLWEISGHGLAKTSYLFGTMHVSSKMVFNLSDSFYLALQRADVVALETNPGNWQENFSRYDLEGDNLRSGSASSRTRSRRAPQDFLSITSLQLAPYEKAMEAALYSNPSILNSFLYRSNSENSSDFEEDTYLDLHIFQTGKKLGKRICGVEDFDGSMQLVKEAYRDAAKEKKKSRSFDYDDAFSYTHLEEAYRSGNLDLLDTINKVNSQSAAFDEKFLYRRNEIQAASIDSILRSGSRLFVGVGAAHLPGARGVIELLRSRGYRLRPVRMQGREGHFKEQFERLRMPVQFTRQTAADGFYSVSVPGTLYQFDRGSRNFQVAQYADMVNGSYYIVARFATHAAILGQSEAQVGRKLDSVLYENIPGRILSKTAIVRNGYRGYDVVNRTRRGDVQRYNIFVTPFELLIFKMSGTGDYVQKGTEAAQFFGSIQLKELKSAWKSWSPASGGFVAELPHDPIAFSGDRQVYAAYDAATKTAVEILRTDVHNYDFLEEDSFDLNLMEESFASSATISRNLEKLRTTVGGYPALDARYRGSDSSVIRARFVIQGPHYYTLVASSPTDNPAMQRFVQSFAIRPFVYAPPTVVTDTLLRFRVQTPVPLQATQKLSLYPDEGGGSDDDDSLADNGRFESRVVGSEATGEKIFVSYYRPSAYYTRTERGSPDSASFKKEWRLRRRTTDTLANGLVVTDYELGKSRSSRMLKGRMVTRDGVGYKIEAQLDTLSAPSAFTSAFFQHFEPLDSFADVDVRSRKSGLFFAQFFSGDTVAHRRAIRNLDDVVVDPADFRQLKRCVESLTWNEKQYLAVKKALMVKLASLQSRESSDYLKQLYEQAGDTVELQYAALESLAAQQTGYAYRLFGQLMQADPPVIDATVDGSDYDDRNAAASFFLRAEDPDHFSLDGSFLNRLSDSLQLTAGIFGSLSPLLNLSDYEEPLLELTAALVTDSLIGAADYAAYLPKLLLEARQALKKQVIHEKAQAIEQARKRSSGDTTDADDEPSAAGAGNEQLSLYARLLLPFWDENAQVPQLVGQLLQSRDRRLRYNTALLLLRNHKSVPDSVWQDFAASDDYRYELYRDLEAAHRTDLFPLPYRTQLLLARSRLLTLQSYSRPDTLVYLDRRMVTYKERSGVLYFFKYKEKKEDLSWKLATAGLFPSDSTVMLFDNSGLSREEEAGYNFTELGSARLNGGEPEGRQIDQLLKKMLYSRRKSAAQFYGE